LYKSYGQDSCIRQGVFKVVPFDGLIFIYHTDSVGYASKRVFLKFIDFELYELYCASYLCRCIGQTSCSFEQIALVCVVCSAWNGYPGTRVATRYPGTRLGPGYPGIFTTRLLSTQHCRLDCEFGVSNIYHKSTANLRANCKYDCTTHHGLACYAVAYIYSLLTD